MGSGGAVLLCCGVVGGEQRIAVGMLTVWQTALSFIHQYEYKLRLY